MNLGEPDGRGEGDSWFTYQSIENRGGVHWAIAGAGGNSVGAGPLDDWDVSRRLIIKFSAIGTVSDVSLQKKECNLWGGTNDFGLTQGRGDCPDARASDLAAEMRKIALLGAGGATLAQYDHYQMHASSDDLGCRFTLRYGDVPGDVFMVKEQNLMLQGRLGWQAIRLDEIKELREPERHMFEWWIPLVKQDGSCLFYSVSKKGDRSQAIQDEVRSKIVAAMVRHGPALESVGK